MDHARLIDPYTCPYCGAHYNKWLHDKFTEFELQIIATYKLHGKIRAVKLYRDNTGNDLSVCKIGVEDILKRAAVLPI